MKSAVQDSLKRELSMCRLVRVGIPLITMTGWGFAALHALAAPAWQSGGRPHEVSDLPSIIVASQPFATDLSPPLPPEPEPAELIEEPEPFAVVMDDEETSLGVGSRLQELIPALPDVTAYDSAASIEPDGTIAPCSTQRGLFDGLHCLQDACWAGRFDAITLWRSAPANRPLFTGFDPSTQSIGATASNANQLESDPLAAPRLTLARLDECGRGYEASYLYAGNFYSQRSLPAIPNGYVAASPGLYHNPSGTLGSRVTLSEQQVVSSLQTVEFNFREPLGWGSTRFLAGFRWLQWLENWSMVDQFENPNVPGPLANETWQTGCVNNLYGGQIGLDSMLWNSGHGMRLEGLGKAGAYYNAASQSSSHSNSASLFRDGITVTSPAGAAFIGEIGLTCVVPLRRNLDFRCGYFGLWLQGIAQPTRQLSGQTLTTDSVTTGTLTTNGSVVLQGVSLGLEGRW
jgi:hypothetical protein